MLVSSSRLLNDFNSFYTPRSQRYYETIWRQEDNNYVLRVNVPGYGKEDVKATVSGNVLSIELSETKRYAYRLPKEYDLRSTKISVSKGVMTVTVPKKPEEMPEEFEITID